MIFSSLLSRYWPALAIAAPLLAGWLYIQRIEALAEQVPGLKAQIVAEKAARLRDVAALTTLSSGLAKASTDTKADQRILQETISATPAPSSPALAAFIAGLRANDAAGKPVTAASTGR